MKTSLITPLIITDNADCRCILLEAGMLGVLNPRPPFITASTTFRHGGYSWLALHHTRQPDPKRNGYTLVGLPEEMEEGETREFFAEYAAQQSALVETREWEMPAASRPRATAGVSAAAGAKETGRTYEKPVRPFGAGWLSRLVHRHS